MTLGLYANELRTTKSRSAKPNGKRPWLGRIQTKRFVAVMLLQTLLSPAFAQRAAATIEQQRRRASLSLNDPLSLRWQYDSLQTLNLTPAVTPDRIYLPLGGGSLICLQPLDGALSWKAEVGGEISAPPIADVRGVYLSTTIGDDPRKIVVSKGAVRALSKDSGVTMWVRTLARPLQGGFAQTNTALFAGSVDGRVYALNKMTGDMIWNKAISSSPFASQPVVVAGVLYVGGEDGTLYAINVASGDKIWSYRTRGAIRGSLVVVDQIVYCGSADGQIYAFNCDTGKRVWRKRTGAGVQSLVGGTTALLAASLDNFVYCLMPRNGELIWKRQLAGRITSPPLIYESSVILTPLAGDTAVILNLADGKQLNAVRLSEDDATGAGASLVDSLLLITTRRGLLAYGSEARASSSAGK